MRRSFAFLLVCTPLLVYGQDDYTLIGAGVRTRPEFDGSRERTVDLVPVLRYYGRPWFARTTQSILEGGARWSARPGLDVGAQLAYEQGPRGDDPGASLGFHVEGDRTIRGVPLNGLVRVRQHLDSDRGTELDLRATIGVYGSHGVRAGVFAQSSFASTKRFESYYGIRESGLLFTSLGLLASYDLSQRWVLTGNLEARRLGNDAAKSPIVEKQSATYATAGLAWRF